VRDQDLAEALSRALLLGQRLLDLLRRHDALCDQR
jgi:hypothetical protein